MVSIMFRVGVSTKNLECRRNEMQMKCVLKCYESRRVYTFRETVSKPKQIGRSIRATWVFSDSHHDLHDFYF